MVRTDRPVQLVKVRLRHLGRNLRSRDFEIGFVLDQIGISQLRPFLRRGQDGEVFVCLIHRELVPGRQLLQIVLGLRCRLAAATPGRPGAHRSGGQLIARHLPDGCIVPWIPQLRGQVSALQAVPFVRSQPHGHVDAHGDGVYLDQVVLRQRLQALVLLVLLRIPQQQEFDGQRVLGRVDVVG